MSLISLGIAQLVAQRAEEVDGSLNPKVSEYRGLSTMNTASSWPALQIYKYDSPDIICYGAGCRKSTLPTTESSNEPALKPTKYSEKNFL